LKNLLTGDRMIAGKSKRGGLPLLTKERRDANGYIC